ncbi:MAG: hypothetical protein ACM3SM_07670 [Bacteroidota bacterium]
MLNISNFSLSFSFSAVWFVLGLIVLAAYTFYNYRYTTPAVSSGKKLLLTLLRSLALLLILFVIFEPVARFVYSSRLKPEVLFFVDASRSINVKDGTDRKSAVLGFLSEASSQGLLSANAAGSLYEFGSSVRKPPNYSSIRFNDASTNFSRIFDSIKTENRNIVAAVVVSDGVITDGINPVYKAEKLGIPVIAFGVGDSARKNNVEVRRVLYNEYIYTNSPTTVSASVWSKGFGGRPAESALYEDNRPVEKQTITLQDGITNISFAYTPRTPGEKKLTFAISPFQGEATPADNRKTFYVKVLDNRLNVLLVAGSPSSDLAFVRSVLSQDPNLHISSITQTGNNRFLESSNQNRAIDSASVLFLVGFPSYNTPQSLIDRIYNEISLRNKPYFIVLSSGTDFNRLKRFQSELPFNITSVREGYTEVQVSVSPDQSQNPLLQSASDDNTATWNNLPPVYKPNSEFQPKAESEVIARTRINNIPVNSPLILSRKLGSKRSLAILARDIWRWKLQTAQANPAVLDYLLLSSIKWLNTREDQKQVTITSSRKVYSLGETVEFAAQVYDATFNPVDNADINLNVTSGSNKYQVSMTPLGGGIYEGKLAADKAGDYYFSGTARLDGKVLGSDNGRFSIGDVDIEMAGISQDSDMLKLLSDQTSGKYFYYKNSDALISYLKNMQSSASREKKTVSEVALWSKEWLLGLIALLFALEWFIRKRSGML